MDPLVGVGPTAAWATLGPPYCRRRRTTAVNSGQPFSQLRSRERRNGRCLNRLMSLTQGSGHRFCAARRHRWVMAPQAMTQQRALPAGTQGSLVTPTTGLGSYNVVHAYN